MKCSIQRSGLLLIAILTLATGPMALAAGQVVTLKKVDESTVTGTLGGLEGGNIVLTSPAAKVALEDLIELTPKGGAAGAIAAPANTNTRKLKGQVIGIEGSWNDEGNTRDKAFDGDLETYFDAPAGHMDDAWVGLDLGAPKVIKQIKFAPRGGRDFFQKRSVGGKFQGSDSADFSRNVTDLATIAKAEAAATLTTLDVSVGTAFRYVRYLTAPQGNGNIAEIEFWGSDSGRGAVPRAAATPTPTAPAVNAVAGAVGAPPAPPPAPLSAPPPATSPALPPATSPALPAPKESKPATKPATQSTVTSQPATAPNAVRVVLASDDQLAGPILDWSEKRLRLGTSFGEGGGLDIPVEVLREVWRGTADQVKQAKAIRLEAGPEDAAFVVKDNAVVAVRGVALGIDGDSLRFKFNDQERKINLAKLVGVALGGLEAKRDRAFRQTVELAGGDMISGKWKSYDPQKNVIGLETPWGQAVAIPFASIARIRSANGHLVYLTDLKPAAVEQVPYFDRLLPYQINRSLTGGPLKLADGDYARGIAVHSRCVLTYDIGGQYDEFKTKVGFQLPEGKLGQCVIRVLGDDKVLYEDLDARGDGKPADVSVKVNGVQRLVLEVDFGKNEDTGDRIVWANPRLLKAKN